LRLLVCSDPAFGQQMAPLTLPLGATSISVKVQPVVLFNICDAYIRRNETQDRVIGTLLGTVENGVVELRNCYAVPHNETNDQVRLLQCESSRLI
jgi:translation initiation factor 3 subunit F